MSDMIRMNKKDFFSYLLLGLEAIDITIYPVLQTSDYASSLTKAFKSPEADDHLPCGWVNDLGSKLAPNDFRLGLTG